MRYELTDEEWAAIKPMLPNKPRGVVSSTASSGSCDLERRGAICRTTSVRTRPAITASFVGDERACGSEL